MSRDMTKKEWLQHRMELANLSIADAIAEKNRIRKELDLLCHCCSNELKYNESDLCFDCNEWFYHQELMEQELREQEELEKSGYYQGTYYDRNGHWYD